VVVGDTYSTSRKRSTIGRIVLPEEEGVKGNRKPRPMDGYFTTACVRNIGSHRHGIVDEHEPLQVLVTLLVVPR
jgi:hypothetical protein